MCGSGMQDAIQKVKKVLLAMAELIGTASVAVTGEVDGFDSESRQLLDSLHGCCSERVWQV